MSFISRKNLSELPKSDFRTLHSGLYSGYTPIQVAETNPHFILKMEGASSDLKDLCRRLIKNPQPI